MPHSEIRGSKPILGSSRLIAEYHVLHRLLLPRHPPNALLALDLIQKKKGFRLSRHRAGSTDNLLLNQKHTFPRDRAITLTIRRSSDIPYGTSLVSVLDLEFYAFAVEPQIMAHCQISIKLMYLSKRCQFVRLDGEALESARRSNRSCGSVERVAPKVRDHKSIRDAITSEASYGGAYRDRTDDPLLAKQVLSQLS